MAAAVDHDLALHRAELAEKVEVLPGLDMRLVRIEEEEEIDKYYVLQGLRDPTVKASDPKTCYAYRRWGTTGSRGDINVEGPMEQSEVEASLAKTFRELTGAEMGSLAVGVRTPGKFWLQRASQPDLKARWKYYVDDGVDGKQAGWYSYAPSANDEVEEVYAQHVANSGAGSHIRWVSSGHFTYKVDLSKMTQENTRTHKSRTIRRSFSHALDRPEEPPAKAAVLKRPSGALARKAKVYKKPAGAGKKTRKRASTIGRKWMVLKGLKERTTGGLKKDDLVKNVKGKVVCRSRSTGGKRNGIKNVSKWVSSFNEAKLELGLSGFVACKKGTKLYTRTRKLWKAKL